jgi:hypothetical protein
MTGIEQKTVHINLDNITTMMRFEDYTSITFLHKDYRLGVVEEPERILSNAGKATL